MQSSRDETAQAPRNAGLDLLRAVAILFVLASHYGQAVPWWGGHRWGERIPAAIGTYGTYGVVLFFALSGYLVGGIALRVMQARPGPRAIMVFLVRRWMRTVPLYYAAIVVFLVISPPPAHWLAHALRYASFTQNLAGSLPDDHWLAVSWSLTVEEWFYLLLGTGGLGLAMLVPAGVACWLSVALLVAVPTWLRWSSPREMWFAYADTLWFDAIAYGLALARIAARVRIAWPVALVLALAGVWCGCIVMTGQLALPAVAFVTFMPSTLATSAVLLIPLALRWRTGRGRPAAALRWVSTRSYGLYLFHTAVLLPISGAISTRRGTFEHGAPWWMVVGGLALSLAGPCVLAELGHRLIERPLMRLRPGQWGEAPGTGEQGRPEALPLDSAQG